MPHCCGPGPSRSRGGGAGAGPLPACRRRRHVDRLVPERAPQALERAGIGVEHDDPAVAVAVGDHRLVRLLHDLHVRRLVEVRRVLVALALVAHPDLLDELALARELEQHVVGSRRHPDLHVRVVAADPDVVLVVDVDAVLGVRPLQTLGGAAPRLQELAVLVELQHRWRGVVFLFCRHRARPVQHPDVVVPVHGDRRGVADDPVVGEPGPRRVDFEHRHAGRRRRILGRGDDEPARPEQQQHSESTPSDPAHRPSRHCPPASALSSARAPDRMPPSPRFPSWQAYS